MSQRISVTCYAGYKGGERPTSFRVGEADLAVREIIDRWYDRDGNYYKVLAEDDVQYLLRHNMEEDVWELVEQSANEATD